MQRIRVVVVDDHEAVLEGVRSRLEREADIQVVGVAKDGQRAIELVKELEPDVLLLDMSLGSEKSMSGVQVTRLLRAQGSKVKILALSQYDSERYIFGVLAEEASGYILKSEPLSKIVDGVRQVHNGQGWWYSAGVLEKLIDFSQGKTRVSSRLSGRELEVVILVALGRSNEEISRDLNMAESTVKNHLNTIFRKLAVKGRGEAAAWAWRNGYIEAGH